MSHFHGVRFYESIESICGTVAVFLGAGFIQRERGLVIATPAHRSAIAAALRSVNFSVEALVDSGNLVMVDAAGLLDMFLVNGTADAVRFESVAGAAMESVAGPETRAVRVYDEMVDLLWQRGRQDAAMRLETLWDRFTAQRQTLLLCGHAVSHLRSGGGRQSLCAHHSHVVADNGVPHPVKVQ
jgi:hypothetical protein